MERKKIKMAKIEVERDSWLDNEANVIYLSRHDLRLRRIMKGLYGFLERIDPESINTSEGLETALRVFPANSFGLSIGPEVDENGNVILDAPELPGKFYVGRISYS